MNGDGGGSRAKVELHKGGGEIVDLQGDVTLGVGAGDVGVDLVSRSQFDPF